MMREIDLIIVHCAATTPDMDIGVREIREWHKARGWSDVGYHFVIRRDGTLESGRPVAIMGAHARGYNESSVGICLAGGVDEQNNPEFNYTKEQLVTLRRQVEKLTRDFPEAEVIGHNDVNAHKACPCFNVKEWWTNKGDLEC